MALPWEDSKKYGLAGGAATYGSPEAWQQQQSATPAPQAPSTPAPSYSVPSLFTPPTTPSYTFGFPAPSSTPTYGGVPSPQKDMSGYTPQTPSFGISTPTPAPNNSVPAPPALGYGGGNYNDLSYDDRLKMQNDASRLSGDPAYRQSEIDRTLGVIQNRQGANQDISAQNDYLYRVLGYQPPQPKQTVGSTSTYVPAPIGNRAYDVGTDSDRDAEARRRVEQAIAEKRRIAEQQKSGLATTFSRLRTGIGEDRALENTQNARILSPFSGRSDYAQGMIARERAKTDRQQQEDFATRSANIDQLLAGYENASEEERKRIVDELVRQDRDFGLSQGQLTGTYNGSRTLAGQQLDWSKDPSNPANQGQVLQNQGIELTNQLNKLKIGNYPEETRQAAALLQQQIDSGKINNETAQWKLQELQNPDSTTNQAAKLELQLKQMEVEYMPQEQRLRLQQLQKQIAEIGKAPYRSQDEVAMDKLKLQTAQEQLKQLQSGSKQTDLNSFVSQLTGLYVSKDPDTGQQFVSNTKALRDAIIAKGLSDDQTDQLLLMFGLPTN